MKTQEAHEPATQRLEIRLALALNGGVSLAIWIGGVANEVLRLCRQTGPYKEFLDILKVNVRADVLTGASAGGLNAVFLALGQLYKQNNLDTLREVWVDRGAFDKLLRNPLSADAPSLMAGDDYFLNELSRALTELIPLEASPDKSLDIDVRLTATSLSGDMYERPDDFGGILRERGHAALIRFETSRDDFARTEPNIKRLARACRSTASFPGAFEPSFVRTYRRNPCSASEPQPPDAGSFRIGHHIEGIRADRFLVDGGVLVNLPVGPAIEAVFSKGASGRVRRVLVLIVPDPSTSETLPPDEETSPPDIASVVGASASGIPRTQSVRQFLDDVRSHNEDVEILRQQRLALLAGQDGVEGLANLANDLFGSYRSGRLAGGVAQAGEELADLVEDMESRPPPTQIESWRSLVASLFSDPDMVFPWIPPDAESLASSSGWGGSVVLRSCGRLLHLLGVIGVDPGQMSLLKGAIHAARELASEIGRKDAAHILGRKCPSGSIAEYGEFLTTHIAEWPGSLADHTSLSTALEWLGATAEALRLIANQNGLEDEFVGSLPQQGEGVRFLLALEVIECSFGDFEDFLEQPLELAQIDSLSPAPIDPQQRSSSQKVAGIQLGHFGAFLKRAWRANDWMWGRLDGVTHLCRILITDAPDSALSALAEGADLEGSPTRARIAAAWARKIQAQILGEELPKVADAVRSDQDLGGASGTFSTQFLSEYDSTTNTSSGELSDSVGLLSNERIGEERLVDELGSDLVTRTSVHSLATGATVLQEGSPKMLRGAIAAVRYTALLAWGITRTAAGRSRLLNTIAALLFGAGLAGVTADLFGANLRLFTLPAWIAFGAGLLLALARAPFVVIPTLLLVLIPQALVSIPEKTPSWWRGPPWPAIHGWDWLPTAGFLLAGFVIGITRRPGWLVGFRRRMRERLRTLDVAVGARTQ